MKNESIVNDGLVDRYRVTMPGRLSRWLNQFIAAELCYGIEVPLIAAIIDRESLGGEALKPKGPAGFGDSGHGHGLGQIDDRTHAGFLHAKFWDGIPLWQDASFNILTAARLLRSNINAGRGDLPLAIASYNCGLKKALRYLEEKKTEITSEEKRVKVLDSATTNGSYVSDVFRRMKEYTPKEAVPNA